jgi:hypothetical protein
MQAINYRRHFAVLLVAAAFLSLFFDAIAEIIPINRIHTYFGLIGSLHAVALVIALRLRASVKRRLAFVVITTVLSMGVPYAGALAGLLGLKNEVGFFSMFAVASSVGAVAYWVLVRVFWLPCLTVLSSLKTVCFCVIGTLVSLLVAGIVTGSGTRPSPAMPYELPTLFWWMAFSGSLYLSDRLPVANKRL